ncbi:hypothetical protein [Rugamonas sp. DEMB1]|uniref:hypothetical protein n=1 Tax=Rugamonas sp. DEMB1 TaxID=3039386 RepID=UPI00244ADAE9|nr:hypothetical protein [Rugamonas sp. DEMB1]WGG48944.1 hypothetical protein QC826_20165 [Rugamonas sp. DEMB1]
MTKQATPDEIIDSLGGTSEVARLCEIQPPSVSEWRKNGIPKTQLKFLRLARPDVFLRLDGGEPSIASMPIDDAHRRATDLAPTAGHGGRQPPSPHQILDTVPEHAVVTQLPPKDKA